MPADLAAFDYIIQPGWNNSPPEHWQSHWQQLLGAQRVGNHEWFAPQLHDWLQALEAAQVPCGPINNLAEVFADPQVLHRGMVQSWSHPLTDTPVELVASPIKLSATPVRADRAPPLLGQHTDEVLAQWLGADEARVADLRRHGAI